MVSRDVSCQTSDCEVIPIKKKLDTNLKQKSRSTSVEGRKKQHFYSDHRRATDSIMSSIKNSEGNRLAVGHQKKFLASYFFFLLKILFFYFCFSAFTFHKTSISRSLKSINTVEGKEKATANGAH